MTSVYQRRAAISNKSLELKTASVVLIPAVAAMFLQWWVEFSYVVHNQRCKCINSQG